MSVRGRGRTSHPPPPAPSPPSFLPSPSPPFPSPSHPPIAPHGGLPPPDLARSASYVSWSCISVIRLRQRLSVRGPGPTRPWADLTWAESSTPSRGPMRTRPAHVHMTLLGVRLLFFFSFFFSFFFFQKIPTLPTELYGVLSVRPRQRLSVCGRGCPSAARGRVAPGPS